MREIIQAIQKFMVSRFNLHEDKEDEPEIVRSIHHNVDFKGANLWTLIFAIFIAAIGLNVNSTAVIIGAMLISPIMGPIMGIGLAMGTNDFELLKKGIKNIVIAAVISIISSTIYFSITPIHDVNSELLARTNPSIWDVFIALFGGFAGIVAGTRKQKSNVIPGVAIATALMPPLCTAGFGLATGQYLYFFWALYLFFINGFFICLATFLVVKHLKFHKKEFGSAEKERRVSRYIWMIALITVLPSIFLAYRIVQRSIFESNAKLFVSKEFQNSRTQIISKNYHINGSLKSIELLLSYL
ncbi:MAG: TIGR00341 family protein [Flavitalea sp.]